MPRPRRVLVVVATLALAVAACGGGDDAATPGGSDPSTTAAVGAADAGATTTATPGGAQPPSGTQSGEPPAAGGPATGAASTGSSVIGVGSLRVGEVAPALLRAGRGDSVVLEVRAQDGAAPSAGTISHLEQVLASASGKQVSVDGTDLIGGVGRDWTQQDIVSAAAGAAQIESGRSQVVLRLLFLHGTFEGNTSVLGVAVAGDVAAIFSDRIDAAAGILVAPSVVEDAVTMHEVGHLLGLVDLLLGTGRGDPSHPGHSRNRRSVMYWQVESDLVTQLLEGGIPRDFDGDDQAELAQIRAG